MNHQLHQLVSAQLYGTAGSIDHSLWAPWCSCGESFLAEREGVKALFREHVWNEDYRE